MVNRPNEDMVTTANREDGVTMGSINRINGVASFGFATPSGFSHSRFIGHSSVSAGAKNTSTSKRSSMSANRCATRRGT